VPAGALASLNQPTTSTRKWPPPGGEQPDGPVGAQGHHDVGGDGLAGEVGVQVGGVRLAWPLGHTVTNPGDESTSVTDSTTADAPRPGRRRGR